MISTVREVGDLLTVFSMCGQFRFEHNNVIRSAFAMPKRVENITESMKGLTASTKEKENMEKYQVLRSKCRGSRLLRKGSAQPQIG